jgi:hypothetical protein
MSNIKTIIIISNILTELWSWKNVLKVSPLFALRKVSIKALFFRQSALAKAAEKIFHAAWRNLEVPQRKIKKVGGASSRYKPFARWSH